MDLRSILVDIFTVLEELMLLMSSEPTYSPIYTHTYFGIYVILWFTFITLDRQPFKPRMAGQLFRPDIGFLSCT